MQIEYFAYSEVSVNTFRQKQVWILSIPE